MPFSDFIKANGIPFVVRRGGVIVATEQGLDNNENGKNYIGFFPEADVKDGDELVFPDGRVIYVYDVAPLYVGKSINLLRAFYKTKNEMAAEATHSQTVFNITSATNSVIGNFNSVTMTIREMREKAEHDGGADKAELQEIISILEKILVGQQPPQKGVFQRFSNCMERNSWITGAIASAVVGWLC